MGGGKVEWGTMTNEESNPVAWWKAYAGWIAAAVVFGPFVLTYAFAFMGLEMPSNAPFGVWFMGALTFCGIVTFADTAWTSIRHKGRDLGCLVPIALATVWWASILYKQVMKLSF